jgi:hypothetical protein
MADQPYIHPAFPQPDAPSIVIWRYMDASKFEWLVNWGRLFMPSADRLGDPFEGTTPLGELEWWKREAANADTEDKRRIIEYSRAFLSGMAQQFRNNYYVSCWHINQYENRAMWGCYTEHSTSVAVKTTYAMLRESLLGYVELGMVRYIDYARERLPTMNMFEYIMHKDTYYTFESEVRAVAAPPPVDELGRAHFQKNHFESETTNGFLVYAPPLNLAKYAYAAEVRELCAKNGLPAPEASRRNRKPVF